MLFLGISAVQNEAIKDLVIRTSQGGGKWVLCKRIGKPKALVLKLVCDPSAASARHVKLEDSNVLWVREVQVFGYADLKKNSQS